MLAIILVPLGVLLLALVFGVWLPRRRRRVLRHGPVPLAAFGRGSAASIPPRPSRVIVTPPPAATPTVTPQTTPPQPPPVPMPVDLRAKEKAADEVATPERGRVLRLQVAGDRRDVMRDDRNAPTLRLERPNDGTLQFLPGRLEVLEGFDDEEEIRFVRTPGPDGHTVTFGRSQGAHYRHVQLHAPTVSRLHARMALDGKTWSLINMSSTNPVVVNGLPLSGEGSTVVLREGDRIEMGEVVFRFHAK